MAHRTEGRTVTVETPPDRAPELRTIAMPAETNASGDIFGGWLLAQMDLAGGSYAIQVARGRVATVAIEAMSFHRPVLVGDLVSCYCRTERIGNTSITVRVGELEEAEQIKVTQGVFTFVALNEDGSKRVLPAA